MPSKQPNPIPAAVARLRPPPASPSKKRHRMTGPIGTAQIDAAMLVSYSVQRDYVPLFSWADGYQVKSVPGDLVEEYKFLDGTVVRYVNGKKQK